MPRCWKKEIYDEMPSNESWPLFQPPVTTYVFLIYVLNIRAGHKIVNSLLVTFHRLATIVFWKVRVTVYRVTAWFRAVTA